MGSRQWRGAVTCRQRAADGEGSLLLLNMHYHPTGERETDADTRVALMLTDERPRLINRIVLVGNVARARMESRLGVGELMRQSGEEEVRQHSR